MRRYYPLIANIMTSAIKNKNYGKLEPEEIFQSLEKPPNPAMGDIASTICFRWGKIAKKNPLHLAEELASELTLNKELKNLMIKISANGGYLNFQLNPQKITEEIIKDVLNQKESYGKTEMGEGRKVIIEHTSTNPTKPLHIGHLRNAVLGDIIARIHRATGWSVEIQNLINEAGKQMAILVWAFQNSLHLKVIREKGMKFDLWLGLIYSIATQELEKNPERDKEVTQLMEQLKKSSELQEFRRTLAEKCVESNLDTLWRLGIPYDLLIWESDIALSGVWDDTLKQLEASEHFEWETDEKSENYGCFVARMGRLEEFKDKKNPDKIVVRSNKVPTYVAHDTAYQMWKFGLSKAKLGYRAWCQQFTQQELWTTVPKLGVFQECFGKGDRVINVIGYEQAYLQSILKHTLALLGLDEQSQESFHLSYKHITLPERRFSGREGNWYEAKAWVDFIVDEAVEAADQIIWEKRKEEINRSERQKIAEMLGVGAIRYWLAKFSNEQTVTYRKEEATSLEGDTAPFIVYSLVRAKKILIKGDIPIDDIKPTPVNQVESVEFELIKTIGNLANILDEACNSMRSNTICAFAYYLAQKFNKLYETCPVLNAPDDVKKFRLSLVAAAIYALENTLRILAIPVPDEM
ncbi:MAG: arginine--tRNA ligase [Promethearchaeota archaeon]